MMRISEKNSQNINSCEKQNFLPSNIAKVGKFIWFSGLVFFMVLILLQNPTRFKLTSYDPFEFVAKVDDAIYEVSTLSLDFEVGMTFTNRPKENIVKRGYLYFIEDFAVIESIRETYDDKFIENHVFNSNNHQSANRLNSDADFTLNQLVRFIAGHEFRPSFLNQSFVEDARVYCRNSGENFILSFELAATKIPVDYLPLGLKADLTPYIEPRHMTVELKIDSEMFITRSNLALEFFIPESETLVHVTTMMNINEFSLHEETKQPLNVLRAVALDLP